MTEKEKMLNGLLYDASDNVLSKERNYAKKMIFKYNKTSSHQKRKQILTKLLGYKIHDDVYINTPFHCDYGYNIQIGNSFYANIGCVILDVNKVIIGDDVLFGPYVQLYTAGHPISPKERLTYKEFGKPITIGKNVWIGGGAIVCPNISIGDNVTIGAGSVVTKDIPDNVVAAGNPCRIIRKNIV